MDHKVEHMDQDMQVDMVEGKEQGMLVGTLALVEGKEEHMDLHVVDMDNVVMI